jgi:acetyl-CoA acetyltransferase
MMVEEFSIKGKVAVIGVGESRYYKRGGSPYSEFRLALQAILAAAEDAGLDPREIDGWATYAGDRNEPLRLAAALGTKQITFSNMFTPSGGGGGCAGAVGNGAAAIVAGYSKYVVVYRSLAQGQFGRFGQARPAASVQGVQAYTQPYGVFTPAQWIALRTRRFMHDHGIRQDALGAIARASYFHAQRNPRAVMYGRPLSEEDYHNSRWIAEPFHLYDCCQENDGAAAVILTAADRARDFQQKPAYILAAAQGSESAYHLVMPTGEPYGSSNFRTLAPRLFAMAGLEPKDVEVAQVYENFTGGTLMSIVEHGFCAPEEVNDFCTFENLTWPNGKLPLNTSGGNLAECYTHGFELVTEAVRQVRGTSTCQVPDVRVSFVGAGPAAAPVSDLLLGAER